MTAAPNLQVKLPGRHRRRPPGQECPRLLVLDHSMVRPRPGSVIPPADAPAEMRNVYWTCREADGPMFVRDITRATGLPHGVVLVAVHDLVAQGRLHLTAGRYDRKLLERVLRALNNL